MNIPALIVAIALVVCVSLTWKEDIIKRPIILVSIILGIVFAMLIINHRNVEHWTNEDISTIASIYNQNNAVLQDLTITGNLKIGNWKLRDAGEQLALYPPNSNDNMLAFSSGTKDIWTAKSGWIGSDNLDKCVKQFGDRIDLNDGWRIIPNGYGFHINKGDSTKLKIHPDGRRIDLSDDWIIFPNDNGFHINKGDGDTKLKIENNGQIRFKNPVHIDSGQLYMKNTEEGNPPNQDLGQRGKEWQFNTQYHKMATYKPWGNASREGDGFCTTCR